MTEGAGGPIPFSSFLDFKFTYGYDDGNDQSMMTMKTYAMILDVVEKMGWIRWTMLVVEMGHL